MNSPLDTWDQDIKQQKKKPGSGPSNETYETETCLTPVYVVYSLRSWYPPPDLVSPM